MQIDPSIFKAYDVRGTVPGQINGEIAYHIGAALTGYLHPKTVAVGRDMRVSSVELSRNLIHGITDCGADVVDLGLCSTQSPVPLMIVTVTQSRLEIELFTTALDATIT